MAGEPNRSMSDGKQRVRLSEDSRFLLELAITAGCSGAVVLLAAGVRLRFAAQFAIGTAMALFGLAMLVTQLWSVAMERWRRSSDDRSQA